MVFMYALWLIITSTVLMTKTHTAVMMTKTHAPSSYNEVLAAQLAYGYTFYECMNKYISCVCMCYD